MVAQLEKEYQIELEWKPFYLRPDTPPEGMELPDYVIRAMKSGSNDRLKEMAKAHGMEFTPTARILNTRLAHEAHAYAAAHGRGIEFHRAVFDLVYGQGKDISKWNILAQAARISGLDPQNMQAEVESGKYTASVQAEVANASQIGVSSVPTYVINDRWAIVGAQPYQAFKNALNQILKEK